MTNQKKQALRFAQDDNSEKQVLESECLLLPFLDGVPDSDDALRQDLGAQASAVAQGFDDR